MTRAGLEVEIADILIRAQVEWEDDHHQKVRRIYSNNTRDPLTDYEKDRLTMYFNMVGFPMKIVFC